MDCTKMGVLIRSLRQEHGLTQNDLANKLHISDKTVSKWERGLGCPDISLIAELSEILAVDITQLLQGDLDASDQTGGSMRNSKFYVCSACGNITVTTGEASISCCGRKLEAQHPQKADDNNKLKVSTEEGQWYITSSHPMEKDNYISFVAYVVGGGMHLIKLYPEWEMHLRIAKMGRGKLVWHSTSQGLLYQWI